VSYSYTVDPGSRLVMVRAEAPCDFAGTVASMKALAADPAFGPGFRILADVRAGGFMTRVVEGRWLTPAEAFARYAGAEPAAFLKRLDTGPGWYDGLCDFVFEGDPVTRALDHASQSNLVDLLAEFLRSRGAPEL
jgi:hypothetical protein